MKRTIKPLILLFLIITVFMTIGFSSMTIVRAKQIDINLTASLYENSDSYSSDLSYSVSSMSSGKAELGNIKMNGDVLNESTFRNRKAYGLNGNVSFSFIYDGALLDSSNVDNWHIRSDDNTNVEDYSLSGSVNKGVLLILKSSDGSAYELATNPITNFLEDNPDGVSNFYTTSGEDVSAGTFYKIIIAYKSGYRYKDGWFKDKYTAVYCMQQYEFYLCDDTTNISIHNLSVTEDDLFTEEFDIEYLKVGETLEDGSVTTGGFKVDKLGIANTIFVSKNNGEEVIAQNGEEFKDSGKYVIKTISKLGTTSEKSIYVFSHEDRGYSTYFGDNLINANRVFRYSDYPTYAKGAYIHINAVNEFVPALYGTITNVDTNEIVFTASGTREAQTFNLDPANYEIDFYSGNPNNTGSLYNYKFKFEVIDESSAPYVNYDNLMNTTRFMDLQSKHYEVAYQTTAGGYIYVCFSLDSYDEAYQYAYEIEKRFVEEKGSDGAYYKSKDNPNVKVYYYDKIELTAVMNYYAKMNVEINYFNPLDEFTYRTYNNDLLEQLESIVLTESIRVFPSNEEKNKMYDRAPYLNNFTFIKVADYDVVSITAYCEKNGKTYDINFDEPLSKQLPVTSVYKIKEVNVYGDIKEYNAYYVAECQTKSTWNVFYNGKESVLEIDVNDIVENKIIINADSFYISDIHNYYDEWAIVTIKAPEVYSYQLKCLVTELTDLELYKKGKYELTFIDRLGNSYVVELNLTGNTRHKDNNADSITYTDLYNRLYNRDIEKSEEIQTDASALKMLISMNVDSNLYTVDSYATYETYLQIAKDVYYNQSSTQEEIDNAYDDLFKAYNNLIISADRTMLKEALEEFEMLNKSLYTTDSYNKYKVIYDECKLIYVKNNPTLDEINDAVTKLEKAKSELVLRGDKTSLFNLMDKVKQIDCSKYTPVSIEALNETYMLAEKVFNDIDASQDEINLIYTELTNKYNSLIPIANFENLDNLLDLVKDIKTSEYTKSSTNNLIQVYNQALTISNDRNSTQSEINEAYQKLKNAYDSLVKIGDSQQLVDAINKLAGLNINLYANESRKTIIDIYTQATNLLENGGSQEQYDEMISLIEETISNAVINENKQELYDLIKNAEEIDLSSKSQSSIDKFQKAYDEAFDVLESDNASDEQIQEAISKLNLAIDNLKNTNYLGLYIAIPSFILLLVVAIVIMKKKGVIG